jgi:hypothetical protein
MTSFEATPPTQELAITPERPPDTTPLAPARPPGAQRGYRALVAAIRRHELVTSHPSVPRRPADHALYRQLTALDATPPIPGDEPR